MGFPKKERVETVNLARTISKEELLENLEEYQKAISFYRRYPDKLVDLFIQAMGEDCTFKLYPFQRVMLRALARHRDIFFTFSRGTSKSFIVDLWTVLQCILYPGTRIAIVASTKGQSGAIIEMKMAEILSMLPMLGFEIRKTEKVKDSFKIIFKNGSTLQNVAAKPSTRGLRFTGLVIEEIIESDGDTLQEVVLPTLAIQRRCANGEFNPDEAITQQKISVTTAGYKDTYAYFTLLTTLIKQIVSPTKAISLGGSYKIPIIDGLQNMDWIRDQKNSGDFNPTSFDREYRSKWSSGAEEAYFKGDIFDKCRTLKDPELEKPKTVPKNVSYIMGVDVGRLGDSSEMCIWKVIPQKGTTSTKQLVYLEPLEKMHFKEQAVKIKLLYEKFKPDRVAIDGNGIGLGLIDELVQSHIDIETGQILPPWGVFNDDKGHYAQFKTADTIAGVMYVIKANSAFNTAMYANYQTQLTTGKLRFLADERVARTKIEASRMKKFQEMTEDEKANWIMPFVLTSILKAQLVNLEQKKEGASIVLSQSTKSVKKDKVSATGYALYYIKVEIDDKAMRKTSFLLEDLNKINSKRSGPTRKSVLDKPTFRGNRDYSKKRKVR